MGNSWLQTKRRDIPQPASVKRTNRLKTRFLHKHKRQGVVKGKIQNLAGVADITNTAQASWIGLKKGFLFQKSIPDGTVALHIVACVRASATLVHTPLFTVRMPLK